MKRPEFLKLAQEWFEAGADEDDAKEAIEGCKKIISQIKESLKI